MHDELERITRKWQSLNGKEQEMSGNSTRSDAATLNLIPAQGHGRRFLERKRCMLAALEAVIERGITSGNSVQGTCVTTLEERIEERWNVSAAIAVNSGSSALRLAFESLRIEAGREVLVPALTFISTAYAVSDAGLVPVFVDVDPQTLTIDPMAAQAAMTKRTAAMVPVHLHGQMAEMLTLLDLADTNGLYVVEDAAQAHGATYTCSSSPSSSHAYFAGSMGDLGCFSLNGVKNMGGLGDGGMVTVSARLLARDRAVADRLRGLRDLGRVSGARYIHDEWGMRARMDEFTALECLLELNELDTWNARRREVAARYSAALANAVVQAPVTAPGRSHVFFNYAARSPSVGVREQFERCLRSAGIEVAEAYTLVSDQRPYRTGRLPCRVEALEMARAAANLITHIPLYPELEEEEIERIVTALQRFSADEFGTVYAAPLGCLASKEEYRHGRVSS
jgi:dTDP-4-amino-4,6-dideoxygalactose transaminase